MPSSLNSWIFQAVHILVNVCLSWVATWKSFYREVSHRWKEQDAYIDHLLSVLDSSGAAEVAKLKESESKLQQRVEEFTRRENVLNMRLATKQQELQELVVSVGPHWRKVYKQSWCSS